MTTQREQQILEMIAANPLVSQQELADKCGITRSSVAVHISNLMRKGLILGKGYVLQTQPYVAVVGGALLDMRATSAAPLIPQDSNPGTVTFSTGGVGRNIAQNLAQLYGQVRFISVFGDDANAALLLENCREVGIDTSACVQQPGASSAVYLYITGPDGEMQLAVSDTAVIGAITPTFLQSRLEVIDRAEVCVMDTNLPADSLAYLAENSKAPLFVDPVSTTKAHKLTDILPRLHTLKANRIETQLLTGITVDSPTAMQKAADILLAQGIRQVFITLSSDGVFAANNHESVLLPIYKGPMVNSTGAGDSFMAALVYSWLQGFSLEKSCRYGLAASRLCIADPATISPAVTPQHIEALIAQPAG